LGSTNSGSSSSKLLDGSVWLGDGSGSGSSHDGGGSTAGPLASSARSPALRAKRHATAIVIRSKRFISYPLSAS
jgi:hypothetical protein